MTDDNEIKRDDGMVLRKELYTLAELQKLVGLQSYMMKIRLDRNVKASMMQMHINGTAYVRGIKVYKFLKKLGFDAETIVKEIVVREKTTKEYAVPKPLDSYEGRKKDYPGAPILHNEFYTVMEMAAAAHLPIEKMRNLIRSRNKFNGKKTIINKLIHYDRDTTLEILLEAKKMTDRQKLCEEINEKRKIKRINREGGNNGR